MESSVTSTLLKATNLHSRLLYVVRSPDPPVPISLPPPGLYNRSQVYSTESQASSYEHVRACTEKGSRDIYFCAFLRTIVVPDFQPLEGEHQSVLLREVPRSQRS